MTDSSDGTAIDKEWRAQTSAFKSPWVLGWIAMVAVIISANLVMMVIAYRTSPGLVVEDYYERGKNYDKTLERRAAESKLGWKAELEMPEKSIVGRKEIASVRVTDKKGEIISAEETTFFAYRPSDASADFSIPMKADSDGKFTCQAVFPMPGTWDIIVSIKRGENLLDIPKRIFVSKKPS